MNNSKEASFCSNCGAPTTSEICPYCKAYTGIVTAEANMEYPVIECKEGNVTFWNFIFPMIFAFSFGIPGVFIPVSVIFVEGFEALPVLMFGSIFGLVGIVAFYIGIKPVVRYFAIKSKGKDIEATVYGYMDDNLLINGNPAQIVKLLVNTDDGNRFILYQLGDIKRPYEVNSKIKLRVYKDMFLISKNQKYYF